MSDIKNNRPVSLFSPFAKMFEIAMFTHLSFFFKYKVSICQHGLVHGRAVGTNLVCFLDAAGPAVANRRQLDKVYFDLSKSFDVVSHDLHKLSCYGVSSSLCTLIKDYRSTRLKYVRVGAKYSLPYESTSSVPQGSIIGPLFWNIFANNLQECFRHSPLLLYSDDNKLYRKKIIARLWIITGRCEFCRGVVCFQLFAY